VIDQSHVHGHGSGPGPSNVNVHLDLPQDLAPAIVADINSDNFQQLQHLEIDHEATATQEEGAN
jgi:hypothetical protein